MSHLALLAIPLLFLSTTALRAQPVPDTAVVVTEILYAPSPASNEFVELYNRSGRPVDLGRLALADATRDYTPVATTDTLLPPGEHVVLARDPEAFAEAFPSVQPIIPADWPALNNGGDRVLLRDAPTGTVLDSVPYAPSWGGANGRSLERIDPAGPSTTASNFASATAAAGATPGRRNSRYDPDETPPVPIFAELTAPTVGEVTFSEPVRSSTVAPGAFTGGAATVTGATLRRDTVAVLSFAAAPSTARLTVSGVEDRVGNTTRSTAVTLARRPTPEAVILNEIMYAPRADDFDDRPNQVEYVELYNRGDQPLSLSTLLLTDRPDETGEADTLRAGRKAVLPPQGYAVAAATPSDAALQGPPLQEAFPDAPLAVDSVAYLPVDAARLGLSNDGGLLRLHAGPNTTLAAIEYRPDWHTPSLDDPRGTALERISPDGRTQAADNWTSSPDPAGGTPGVLNAVSHSPPPEAPDQMLTVAPSPFSVERDGATRIRYRLASVPNLVRVRIYDARGRKVRALEEARLTGHTGTLVWDGRDDAGNRVRVGVYVVLFEALRAGDGTVTRLKTPVVVARPLP